MDPQPKAATIAATLLTAAAAATTPSFGDDDDDDEEALWTLPPPTALLGPNGERPTDDDIEAVHNNGRCFDDNDAPSLHRRHVYTANEATHHDFEAFNPASYVRDDGTVPDDAKEAYDIARSFEAEQEARGRMRQLGDAFRRDGSRVDTIGDGVADGMAFDEDLGPDLQPSHEDKVQRGQTGMGLGFLRKPCCQARGSAPNHVNCFQCGENPGWDLQMPSDVFETAWRAYEAGWGEAAVGVIMMMARLLRQMRDAEVVARCCVCNDVECILRAGLMLPEWRIEWLDGPRRPQDERETARKAQINDAMLPASLPLPMVPC